MVFIPGALIRILLFVGPALMWNKNTQLRNYRNDWKRFQVEMEKLMKSPFKCLAKNKIRGIFSIGIISMSGLGVLIQTRQWRSDHHRPVASTFPVLYMMNGTANIVTYWVVNNTYMISSTKQLIKLVQRSISKDNYADLRRLIDLWVMLCDLNEQFINSHSILFLFLFCSTIIIGIIGVFCTVSLLVHGADKSIGLTYFISTIICMLTVMVFCESANSVTKYKIHELRIQLLDENVTNKDKKLIQVISLFLQTIETKSPEVTFYGCMTVDRSSVSSVLGTAINFLVVLKQFGPNQLIQAVMYEREVKPHE
ncbi:uncharacterized protein LOC135843765 [Planococcus citri]|uniref:uncharacterized protein LOC135843765 n=1 Tax=Planococcus citri TaxID=170843 RepID=UPI0031F7EACF